MFLIYNLYLIVVCVFKTMLKSNRLVKYLTNSLVLQNYVKLMVFELNCVKKNIKKVKKIYFIAKKQMKKLT